MSWQCAAVAHYNLLQHLREGTLDAYDLPLWDFNAQEYERWSINGGCRRARPPPAPPWALSGAGRCWRPAAWRGAVARRLTRVCQGVGGTGLISDASGQRVGLLHAPG